MMKNHFKRFISILVLSLIVSCAGQNNDGSKYLPTAGESSLFHELADDGSGCFRHIDLRVEYDEFEA
jgi:hypothetical protein